MKISIVMAYFDRLPQLKLTLNTIASSNHKDLEVIIVNDGSNPRHFTENIPGLFPFAKVIDLYPHGANGSCPSALLNIGISKSTGDVIMIQNPENLHVGDVVSHASFIRKNEYFLYACREITKPLSFSLRTEMATVPHYDIQEAILRKLNIIGDNYKRILGFKLRNRVLNWCVAITREDMKDLNGFDERYKDGCWFDDNEFFIRIIRKGMDVIKVPDYDPDGKLRCVLHQWHADHYIKNNRKFNQKKSHNKHLFENVTKYETTYRANPQKEIIQ